MIHFYVRQINEIKIGGFNAIIRKINRLILIALYSPLYIYALLILFIIRTIRPWLLIRLSVLQSQRIGHFAANTELYFCERDFGINTPKVPHFDLFYLDKLICNKQLAIMWKRLLYIWPIWLIEPIVQLNRLIPGGKAHEVGTNSQMDIDVNNLFDRTQPHLQFTDEEEVIGSEQLFKMGIPRGAQFVCIIARDAAYLDFLQKKDWSYHNYRDVDISNFVLAAETLADKGYFVIRMGQKVSAPLISTHSRIIDYATNGMRSDFMDIYLGAKCSFCISTGTGWDAVPYVFRVPIVYVNYVSVGRLITSSSRFLSICKHHLLLDQNRKLTLSEIFSKGVGFCIKSFQYNSMGVELVENSPEEIRDAALEMSERLSGAWQEHPEDSRIQKHFWDSFQNYAINGLEGKALHGEIRARFGANFLRNNPDWLR